MYKQAKQQRGAFRFRRFSRAGWAAYSSMHREVTIGRLATHVADRGLRKSAAAVALGLVLGQGALRAQSDDGREVRTLPEVQVSLQADSLLGSAEPAAVISADQIQQSSVRTVSDLVALLPAVDMRLRGVGDVQGDLAMRGGTFDQMVVLLGGINITDPQTGHHNMDLPIDVAMVERVELLLPSQLLERGVVAYCGAVNIVVCEQYAERLLAEVSGGSHGTANASLLATRRAGQWSLTAAGSYHRSDGYMPNTDYRHGSLFVQAARHARTDDWHLQLGGQLKGFGSQAFYSTAYPDQYEATRTLIGSVTNVHRFSADTRLESALYGRLHADRFELFRDGYVSDIPSWYTGHNRHLGSTLGLRSRLVRRLGAGQAVGGIDLRREGIRSNVLGLADSTLAPPYTKSASRWGLALFGGYRYTRGRWSGGATALGQYNTAFGPDYGLSADLRCALPRADVALSASRTFRLPSFTDLYYQGANQQANPDLGAESSTTVECSLSGRDRRLWRGPALDYRLAAYYRHGSGTIDWVRRPQDEMWYSMNHTALDALGIDAAARLRHSILTLNLAYSWCHTVQDAGQWVSGSALDYLRHKAVAALRVQATRRLALRADAAWRHREGSYAEGGEAHPYGGVLLLGAGADYSLGRLTLFVDGRNLTGRRYRDHGGVPQPGATLMAGLRLGASPDPH